MFAIGLWTAALIVGCGGGNSHTLSDRYAPRFREQAKRLHAEFWELRDGAASPLS